MNDLLSAYVSNRYILLTSRQTITFDPFSSCLSCVFSPPVLISHLMFGMGRLDGAESVSGKRGQNSRPGREKSCEPHHRIPEGPFRRAWGKSHTDHHVRSLTSSDQRKNHIKLSLKTTFHAVPCVFIYVQILVVSICIKSSTCCSNGIFKWPQQGEAWIRYS